MLNLFWIHPLQLKPGDSLDLRIEALVRDWHESADMLFSIHPLDGSLLVWHVEYLDEYISRKRGLPTVGRDVFSRDEATL